MGDVSENYCEEGGYNLKIFTSDNVTTVYWIIYADKHVYKFKFTAF